MARRVFFAAAQHLDLLSDASPPNMNAPSMSRIFCANVAGGHTVDSVKHGQFAVEQLRLVLREISYLDVVADLQRSVKRDLTHNAFYEGGLAFAVLAYECHFVAAFQCEACSGKHFMVSVGFPDIVGCHQGSRPIAERVEISD